MMTIGTPEFRTLEAHLAYVAAVSGIEINCYCHRFRETEKPWYDLTRLSDNDPETAAEVDESVAYLTARRLLNFRESTIGGRHIMLVQIREENDPHPVRAAVPRVPDEVAQANAATFGRPGVAPAVPDLQSGFARFRVMAFLILASLLASPFMR